MNPAVSHWGWFCGHHRGPAPHGGHLGQQQQVQGLRHPHHQVQRFSRTRRALWRKPDRDSTKNEILQRPRFYKERDSTKNEILQRTRFYKERDSTKNEILQRTRFSRTRRALWRKPDRDSTPSGPSAPWGGLWASSNKSRAPFTLIIKFTGADSSPSKSSNSQHRIHRAWTLCLTRCTRCTSEATKKRE